MKKLLFAIAICGFVFTSCGNKTKAASTEEKACCPHNKTEVVAEKKECCKDTTATEAKACCSKDKATAEATASADAKKDCPADCKKDCKK